MSLASAHPRTSSPWEDAPTPRRTPKRKHIGREYHSATIDLGPAFRRCVRLVLTGVGSDDDREEDLHPVGCSMVEDDEGGRCDSGEESDRGITPVMNFLISPALSPGYRGGPDGGGDDDDGDPWLLEARDLLDSTRRMSELLSRKEVAYCNLCASLPGGGGGFASSGPSSGLTMTDAERSELDGAVASFAASAAKRISDLTANGGGGDSEEEIAPLTGPGLFPASSRA